LNQDFQNRLNIETVSPEFETVARTILPFLAHIGQFAVGLGFALIMGFNVGGVPPTGEGCI
jgi:hypothetical protein